MSKKNFNQYFYEKWNDEVARDYVKNQCNSNENLETYVSKNGYFLTATFDQKYIKERKAELDISSKADTSIELQNMRHLIVKIYKKLVGKNYNRPSKQYLQPLFFLFVDAETSKYRKTFESEDIKNLHIHALVIVPEELKEKAKFLENSYFMKLMMLRNLDIDNVEFARFDKKKSTVKRLAGYNSKFAVKSTTTGMDVEDIMIYPEHLHERRPISIKLRTKNYSLRRLIERTDSYLRSKKQPQLL